MQKTLKLTAALGLLMPSLALATSPMNPQPVSLIDASFTAQELQSVMDAVHDKGKHNPKNPLVRTMPYSVVTSPLHNPFQELGVQTKVRVTTKLLSGVPSPLLPHCEYSRLTVRLGQGKNWVKAVVPLKYGESLPPRLIEAPIAKFSMSRALQATLLRKPVLPVGAPWANYYGPLFRQALRVALRLR